MNLRKDHCRCLDRPANRYQSDLPLPPAVPRGAVGWQTSLNRATPGAQRAKEMQSIGTDAVGDPDGARPLRDRTGHHTCVRTTLGNGYLGSRIDEERSEMRYLV